MKSRSLVATAVLFCALWHGDRARAQSTPTNLALGLPASFDPAPNYSYCTDPDDRWQLTDGKYSSQGPLTVVEHSTSLWTQKGTVGWDSKSSVIICIDLGKVQPISGLSFSTAAGRAGVEWPSHIYMAFSDDNATWHSGGDLVALSNKNGAPPASGYTPWRYVTHDLRTHGRYVAVSVAGYPYVFCDELEIYRGPDALLQAAAPGLAVSGDLSRYTQASIIRGCVAIANRLGDDLAGVRAELASSALPVAQRQNLQAQLDTLADQCDRATLPLPDPATVRIILPIDELDARILAVHGSIVGGSHPGIVLWKQHRYQWLPLLAVPPANPEPALNITMMKNEFRSDCLLVTNASAETLSGNVRIDGLTAPQARALQLSAVPWTDTAQDIPVATALPELAAGLNGYSISLPAGLTTRLWLTVDSAQLPPGTYHASVTLTAGGQTRHVPLGIRVSRVVMGKPRLSLTMWDYTNAANYGITNENTKQAIALMDSHFVDTPTGQRWTLPGAGENCKAVNADNLKNPLDWKAFDSWRAQWPHARQYFLFPSVGDQFAGAKMGTAEFDARVGAWARELSQGMIERNLKPEQLVILLVDEPESDAQALIVSAWEHAIKAAAPQITIFEDPLWDRADQVKLQSALTQADILCPFLPKYVKNGPPVQAYYRERQAAGQKLWFYQTYGPAHLADPTAYYRMQAWMAFAHGAVGMGFWSFGDIGAGAELAGSRTGRPTSWNEYLNQNSTPYSPAFLDATSVTDSIHWEAVREGIEDYEYLSMLRDKIASTSDADWSARARQLLNEAPDAVIGTYAPEPVWKFNPRVDLADRYRLKILALLEAVDNRSLQ